MSETERAAARHDLDAAVQDLLARHVISPQEAERARRAELGLLALRMSGSSFSAS